MEISTAAEPNCGGRDDGDRRKGQPVLTRAHSGEGKDKESCFSMRMNRNGARMAPLLFRASGLLKVRSGGSQPPSFQIHRARTAADFVGNFTRFLALTKQ